ncbi:hypothetical protein BSKO_00001 [Bryopsis sp. KO-2023]|nr:hypothetical protein BSKO_00001 [Bryopsis sp. KO-2023]
MVTLSMNRPTALPATKDPTPSCSIPPGYKGSVAQFGPTSVQHQALGTSVHNLSRTRTWQPPIGSGSLATQDHTQEVAGQAWTTADWEDYYDWTLLRQILLDIRLIQREYKGDRKEQTLITRFIVLDQLMGVAPKLSAPARTLE